MNQFKARYTTTCTVCGTTIQQAAPIWGENADFVRNGMGHCAKCAGVEPVEVEEVEEVEAPADVDLDELTKAELLARANDLGIDVPSKATNAYIVELIQAELG